MPRIAAPVLKKSHRVQIMSATSRIKPRYIVSQWPISPRSVGKLGLARSWTVDAGSATKWPFETEGFDARVMATIGAVRDLVLGVLFDEVSSAGHLDPGYRVVQIGLDPGYRALQIGQGSLGMLEGA